MQEIWLPPNTSNSKTLGKFDDFTKTITDKDGKKVTVTKLMLYTKVPGVAEQSSTTVLDDEQGKRIKAEYSAAWDLYLKNKAKPQTEAVPTAVEFGVKGTPIEYADFLGKDHLARLKMMGFLTVEQLAEMSDAQCQNIGFGATAWRKRAGEFLVVARDQSGAWPAPVAPAHEGPSVADLMAQLADANAKIAALMEMVPMPAPAADDSVDAPKRRGRPRKATTEAQAEA